MPHNRTHRDLFVRQLEMRRLLAVTAVEIGQAVFDVDLGDTFTLTNATFDDDAPGANEPHGVYIDWGDGTMGAGAVIQESTAMTLGTVTGSHDYASVGSYTVQLEVYGPDETLLADTAIVRVNKPVPPPVDNSTPTPTTTIGPIEDSTSTTSTNDQPPPFISIIENETENAASPASLSSENQIVSQSIEYRTSSPSEGAVIEKGFVLRIVSPDGNELSDNYKLQDDVLENLPSLFHNLPDDRYRVYLLREDGTQRLVIDVNVWEGRPGDLSEEMQDAREGLPLEPEAVSNEHGSIDSSDVPSAEHDEPSLLETEASDIETSGLSAADVNMPGEETTVPILLETHPSSESRILETAPDIGRQTAPTLDSNLVIGSGLVALASNDLWKHQVDQAMQQRAGASDFTTSRRRRRLLQRR